MEVEITTTGRVWGDVVTIAFSTEEGAFLRGKIRMEEKLDLGFAPEEGGHSQEEIDAFGRRAEAQYRKDFQYYAGSGTVEMAGREVECLELPRPVLEKFYSGNARRIIPGLGL